MTFSVTNESARRIEIQENQICMNRVEILTENLYKMFILHSFYECSPTFCLSSRSFDINERYTEIKKYIEQQRLLIDLLSSPIIPAQAQLPATIQPKLSTFRRILSLCRRKSISSQVEDQNEQSLEEYDLRTMRTKRDSLFKLSLSIPYDKKDIFDRFSTQQNEVVNKIYFDWLNFSQTYNDLLKSMNLLRDWYTLADTVCSLQREAVDDKEFIIWISSMISTVLAAKSVICIILSRLEKEAAQYKDDIRELKSSTVCIESVESQSTQNENAYIATLYNDAEYRASILKTISTIYECAKSSESITKSLIILEFQNMTHQIDNAIRFHQELIYTIVNLDIQYRIPYILLATAGMLHVNEYSSFKETIGLFYEQMLKDIIIDIQHPTLKNNHYLRNIVERANLRMHQGITAIYAAKEESDTLIDSVVVQSNSIHSSIDGNSDEEYDNVAIQSIHADDVVGPHTPDVDETHVPNVDETHIHIDDYKSSINKSSLSHQRRLSI